jgi:RNA polymerase sigma-70 factor (ECF subfamily)
MQTTPVSLLERLRRPADPDAWPRFVALYTPLLYEWARRLGLQQSDAADLVQDVFLALWQSLPEFTYDRDGSFRAWLRTIVLNKWRDRLRRRGDRPLHTDESVLAELATGDGALVVEEAEYRTYLVGRAAELIRADFQPTTWKAFWGCAVEGRPVAEVAGELGLAPNAVYQAKFRVLQRLREELKGVLD